MACMRDDVILNAGEHDHPPPPKQTHPEETEGKVVGILEF